MLVKCKMLPQIVFTIAWLCIPGGLAEVGSAQLISSKADDLRWQATEGDWSTVANWFDRRTGTTAVDYPMGASDERTGIVGDDALVHYQTDGSGYELYYLNVYGDSTLSVEDGVLRARYFDAQSGGTVKILGGEVHVRTGLGIGDGNSLSTATLNLEGGLLDSWRTWVGDVVAGGTTSNMRGQFFQTDGMHNSWELRLFDEGDYFLQGGDLDAEFVYILGSDYTGFEMSGGEANIDVLWVNTNGHFNWTGGNLTIGSLQIAQSNSVLSLPQVPSALTFSGIVSLTNGVINNKHLSSWTTLPNSLVLLPSDGSDPRTEFASFNTGGKVHRQGESFLLDQGEVLEGSGGIWASDYVIAGQMLSGRGSIVLEGSGRVTDTAHLDSVGILVRGDNSQELVIEGGYWENSGIALIGDSTDANLVGRAYIYDGDFVNKFNRITLLNNTELHILGGNLSLSNLLLTPTFSTGSSSLTNAKAWVTDADLDVNRVQIGGPPPGNPNATGTPSDVQLFLGTGATLRADLIDVGRERDRHGASSKDLVFESSTAVLEVNGLLNVWESGKIDASDHGVIRLLGAEFNLLSTSPENLAGLEMLTLEIEAESYLELAGQDLGMADEGFVNNYLINNLIIGADSAATLHLVDNFDNQPDTEGSEALYLNSLTIGTGSMLHLDGLNVYTRQLINNGAIDVSGGGGVHLIPEPTTWVALVFMGTLARLRRSRAAAYHFNCGDSLIPGKGCDDRK